jgi:hypothetical protein
MSPEDRALLVETSIALAALVELLADDEGDASLNEFRSKFRDRFAPLLERALKHPPQEGNTP